MNEKELVAILARVPLFHNLTHRQLQSVAKMVVEREYPAAGEIVTQGEVLYEAADRQVGKKGRSRLPRGREARRWVCHPGG